MEVGGGGGAAVAATAMAADDEDPARRSSCGIVSSSASVNSHVASDAPSAIPAISSPPPPLMRGLPSSAAPAMAAADPALSGDRVCFNPRCKGSTSSSWKPGWLLRSGRAADLCEACGLAYEHGRFCDTFHVDETGWRTCISCSKQIHCGCIVSIFLYVLLDTGGVECTTCAYKNNGSRLALESSAMNLSSLATGFQRMEAFSSEGWTHGKMERIAWTPEIRPLFQVPYVPPANHVGARHWQTLSGLERQGVNEPISIETTGRMGSAIGYSVKAESDGSGIMNAKSSLPKLPVPTQPVDLDLLQRHRNTGVFNTHMSRDDSANFYSDPNVSKDGFLQGDTFTRNLVDGTSSHATTLSWHGTNFKESGSLYGLNGTKNVQYEPPVNASLTMSLGPSNMKRLVTNVVSEPSVSKALFASEKMRDSKEGSKFPEPSAITQKQKQVTSKPPQAPSPSRMEILKDLKDSSQGSLRVARPPVEGRGKNQLLPRYWPRITEQELQQITSGDSNSSITPLFEKMLSASDAGRIGRLVLPKACAEAYFPSISQPEGVPLKIQDVNGREWSFQFRFWPNNNSRMYVLEGVTPCIQSMQLQAGDTVTFSRLDPEGKLIMGYRRAPSSMNVQDPQCVSVNTSSSTPLIPGGSDNVNNTINFSGSLSSQAAKGSAEPGGTSNIMEAKHSWSNIENKNSKPKDGSAPQTIATDKKKGRTFGLKSKKPRLEAEDSIDKSSMSWEELQELLQPPPNVVPNIVTVDGHEFEEYEEPPVLQECSTPPSRHAWSREESGGQPNDDLDNANSPTRVVCTDDGNIPVTPQEEDDTLGGTRDLLAAGVPSGLEALANAATMGENKASSSSPTPTTKHPRHRSGCTCIVCIQPPSGKGPKHKATCTCNVCTTVKRRFKTLMMRRKKRQSEQEEETVRKKSTLAKESCSGNKTNDETKSMSERKLSSSVPTPGGSSNRTDISSVKNTIVPLSSSAFAARPKSIMEERTIDLNSQPERDEEAHKDTGRVSMMMLFQNANYPLEKYLQQQGISDLSCLNQAMSPPIPFSGNLSTARLEEQIRTPHILKSESSEDQDCGLTQVNVDGSKGGYDIDYIMKEALNSQVSSQSS